MLKILISLIIQKTQFKITLRQYFIGQNLKREKLALIIDGKDMLEQNPLLGE